MFFTIIANIVLLSPDSETNLPRLSLGLFCKFRRNLSKVLTSAYGQNEVAIMLYWYVHFLSYTAGTQARSSSRLR